MRACEQYLIGSYDLKRPREHVVDGVLARLREVNPAQQMLALLLPSGILR